MTFPHDRETVDGALAAFRKALRERAGAEGQVEDSKSTREASESERSRPRRGFFCFKRGPI